MASFYRKLTKILKSYGCAYVGPAKGDHEKWFSPMVEKNIILDPGTKSRHTCNEVLKQAGIDEKI